MSTKKVILPIPENYINYITNLIMNDYIQGYPVQSQISPTTKVARMLVNQESIIIVTESEDTNG